MALFEHKDMRIYYEDRGNGPPLLFMPGLTESSEDLADIIAALEPNFRVIAVDMPGSGRSLPQPRQYSPTYYHEDAEAMVALMSSLGVDSYHVAGFSDGGEVAIILAGRYPEAVRSVFVWGAAGALDPNTAGPMIPMFHDIIDSPPDFMKGYSEHLKAQYGEANARAMIQSATDAWQSIIEAGGDIGGSRAGNIHCPVLIVAGEHDPFAPVSLVRPLAARIPKGELIGVSGAGHSVHEDAPQLFMETLLGWLARQV